MNERPFRILIIEDSAEDRETYRRRIARGREEEFHFKETGLGEDGLRICREFLPDCILLDFQLPDLNGLEFLDRFQVEFASAEIPIVMLTGHGNEAVAVQALKKGAEDYLVKGLNSDNLAPVVQLAVQKAALRRELAEQRRAVESLSADRVRLIAELTEHASALAEANQRKDEFLAMLAHELRNPLAPIRNGLSLLEMEVSGQEETLQLMQHQMDHLIRLVDDLLDVSRIVQGKIELRRERVELMAIVNRAVRVLLPTAGASKQEMCVTSRGGEIWLQADPVRLAQVFENLLNNASKYTPSGGRIEIVIEVEPTEAIVEVRDNGIGIDAKLLPKVFDLFVQADRTLDRSQGGLGIGLTLVRRLTEMHGGTVSAHSDGPGQGSRFVVRLPRDPEVQLRASEPSASATSIPRRILAVDDNVDAATMLGRLLSALGEHTIEVAFDGMAMLPKVKEFRPDVIFLDIGLPGKDGYQVARELRQDRECDRILLVALTGYGQEEDRRCSKEAGFDEHLLKPPSIELLKAMLVHPKLQASAIPSPQSPSDL